MTIECNSNTNAYISILEVDTIQHVNIICNDRITYLFQNDNSPIFHFTHYRNELIKLAKTSIVSIWDADIFLPLNQLYQSVNDIRTQKSVYSTPYNGVCYDVPDDISISFRNDLTIDVLCNSKEIMKCFYGRLSVGGVYVVDKEEYIQLGLENEKFIGWGA